MAKQKILVPYNFTRNDEKAVDFVIGRFANDKNVEVTLLHAYTPVPDIDFRDNPIMEKMASNLTYLRQKIGEREVEMKAAGDRLLQNGFSADQVRYMFRPVKKDVTQDIIDLVTSEGFNIVVLNRDPSRIIRFFTTSTSEKVEKNLKKGVAAYIVT